MGLADFHIHTTWSWDGTAPVKSILRYCAENTRLDVIAITDHDEIRGALEAEQLAPQYGLEVIPGCEISTADGHLLALFIREKIPAGLSAVETIMRIGEQGGLGIAPHPMAKNARGLGEIGIRNAFRDPETPKILVGMEVFNAGLLYRSSNDLALNLAQKLGVAMVGSSDSHVLWTIGAGATAFAGNSAADVRSALEYGATVVVHGAVFPFRRLVRSWAGRYLLRRMGLATS